MADYTAAQARASRPAKAATAAGEVKSVRFSYAVDTTLDQLGNNGDRIFLCWLPAGHVPQDALIQLDDLDDGTALLVTVGLEKADGTTDDADCIVLSSNAGQAGGVVRANAPAMFSIPAVEFDRRVYIEAATAAGTDKAGTIRGWFSYVTKDRDA